MRFRPAFPSRTPTRASACAAGPHAPLACVVTGIDGGADEEQAALAIARTLQAQGLSVAVMTPAIAGDPQASGHWASLQLQRLAAAGSFRLPESALCPYRLPPASDLVNAAARGCVRIDPEVVADAREVLATWVDAVVVMGTGGLRARLGPGLLAGQLFARLALPVVQVRAAGMSGEAGASHGLLVAGWVESMAKAAASAAIEPSVADGLLRGGPRLGTVNAVQAAPLLQALRAARLRGRAALP